MKKQESGEKQEYFPMVSVIIPAYRCAETIDTAIASVLGQSVELELIVINDQSPDNLDLVMEKYRDDKRVRYVKNEKNLGASGSRNKGVRMARGEYVAFLDADDWWDTGKLEAQIRIMKAKKVVLCSTGRELVTPEGQPTGRVIGVKEEITYRDLLRHNCINCSSAVLRTQVAREFPMEHEDSHEDYILWLRILKKYGKAAAIDKPLLKYRLTAKGKSGSKLKSAKMTYTVYRYAGFGRMRALLLFVTYAANGVWKYGRAYLRGMLRP